MNPKLPSADAALPATARTQFPTTPNTVSKIGSCTKACLFALHTNRRPAILLHRPNPVLPRQAAVRPHGSHLRRHEAFRARLWLALFSTLGGMLCVLCVVLPVLVVFSVEHASLHAWEEVGRHRLLCHTRTLKPGTPPSPLQPSPQRPKQQVTRSRDQAASEGEMRATVLSPAPSPPRPSTSPNTPVPHRESALAAPPRIAATNQSGHIRHSPSLLFDSLRFSAGLEAKLDGCALRWLDLLAQ